jgi:hypothetical protein
MKKVTDVKAVFADGGQAKFFHQWDNSMETKMKQLSGNFNGYYHKVMKRTLKQLDHKDVNTSLYMPTNAYQSSRQVTGIENKPTNAFTRIYSCDKDLARLKHSGESSKSFLFSNRA